MNNQFLIVFITVLIFIHPIIAVINIDQRFPITTDINTSDFIIERLRRAAATARLPTHVDFEQEWQKIRSAGLVCDAKVAPDFINDDNNTKAFEQKTALCIVGLLAPETIHFSLTNEEFQAYLAEKSNVIQACARANHRNVMSVKSIVDVGKTCL
jgi:hypothetical protein